MQEYILLISKYGIVLCMAIYAMLSLFALKKKDHGSTASIWSYQRLMIFVVQFLGFLQLYVATRDRSYLALYGLMQIFLILVLCTVRFGYRHCNRVLLDHVCMLMGIGSIMIARLSITKAIHQYFIAVLAFAGCLLIPLIVRRIRFLQKMTWLYAAAGLLMLSVVLVLGEVTHGSKLSYTFHGITFQPSEFVKILFVFCMAGCLYEKQNFARIAMTCVLAAMHVLLLVLSTDLGGALIFYVCFLFILLIATKDLRIFFLDIAAGVAAAFVAYRLFDHVKVRVLAWQNPWEYIDTKGYQIAQSLFAIGNGGLFGSGLKMGNPGAIPAVSADFIFSAICEEMGVIVGISLIVIAFTYFVETMKMASAILEKFYRIVVYGLGIIFIFQCFLTVGGGIKLIPLTGVTFPFVSYGGSSLTASIVIFFLIQGIYLRMHAEKKLVKVDGGDDNGSPYFNKLENEKRRSRRRPSKKIVSTLPQINATILVFGTIFAAAVVYLTVVAVFDREELFNNRYNTRQELYARMNERGRILSSGGDVLAYSRSNDDGNSERVYPYGKLFAHAVGFAVNGQMGVEKAANYSLLHSDVSVFRRVFDRDTGIKDPGNDVYTTLDLSLQQIADGGLGRQRGAVIVTEPDTGKVLAMVSHPNFDPNTIAAVWNEMVTDETNSSLLNRATQGLYPPGSTFKMVTALEYLKENSDTWHDFGFDCPGYYQFGDRRIVCFHGKAHGSLDLEHAFAQSCNSAFASIGMGLNRDKLADTLKDLKFGEKLTSSFPVLASRLEVSNDTADAEMMQIAIGQGNTQVSPLQLHMITQAVSNEGTAVEPYIVSAVVNAEGRVLKEYVSPGKARFMSASEASYLKDLMTEAVESGTAKKLAGKPYSAAGKTGSAEYNTKGDSHAWFTGFASLDGRTVCVTVIVEGAGTGSDAAVPIAAQIFDSYFAQK